MLSLIFDLIKPAFGGITKCFMENLNTGRASDGYYYSPESPEVVAYKKLYALRDADGNVEAELADDVAVGSVIGLREQILTGGNPAVGENYREGLDEILEMIRATVINEPGNDVPAETDGVAFEGDNFSSTAVSDAEPSDEGGDATEEESL